MLFLFLLTLGLLSLFLLCRLVLLLVFWIGLVIRFPAFGLFFLFVRLVLPHGKRPQQPKNQYECSGMNHSQSSHLFLRRI